ncbi:MAG: folylpolyglutamate synthase/dihydrofolate synthase family protein [Eubacteriales bacterium]|nr:folylpolyglutamate synthase/dihydrofolate synthase family protein [Eubacteriales bacterium]
MTYEKAIEYINSTEWFGSKLGLERINELMDRLGNPQDKLKFVHIAGTNGKGSCSAMLASVLKAAGYKTGLYTSPYIYRFNERMQINGKEIDNDILAGLISEIQPIADSMEEHPLVFEMVTAAAMLWFEREHCDIVVLEVGLGGRLDATNVISAPEAAVIMNIGLDHVQQLGKTVAEIAAEKGGIIKKGCSVVLYQQNDEAEAVIQNICLEKNADLYTADFSAIVPEFDSLDGQTFTYKDSSYALPLLGAHQRRNAATAIEAVEVLRHKGWNIDQTALEYGLYSVYWPARFELLMDDPYFVLDGGHNPQCAGTVVQNLADYFPGTKHIMLVGVLEDKDYETLFSVLNLASDEYICITPDSPRALSAEKLAEFLGRFGKSVSVCDSIEDGVFLSIDRAREEDGMVCAVGSLYMAGEIRACLGLY